MQFADSVERQTGAFDQSAHCAHTDPGVGSQFLVTQVDTVYGDSLLLATHVFPLDKFRNTALLFYRVFHFISTNKYIYFARSASKNIEAIMFITGALIQLTSVSLGDIR